MKCTSSSQAGMTLDSVMEIPLNGIYVTFEIIEKKKRENSKLAFPSQKSITTLHIVFLNWLYSHAGRVGNFTRQSKGNITRER